MAGAELCSSWCNQRESMTWKKDGAQIQRTNGGRGMKEVGDQKYPREVNERGKRWGGIQTAVRE